MGYFWEIMIGSFTVMTVCIFSVALTLTEEQVGDRNKGDEVKYLPWQETAINLTTISFLVMVFTASAQVARGIVTWFII